MTGLKRYSNNIKLFVRLRLCYVELEIQTNRGTFFIFL